MFWQQTQTDIWMIILYINLNKVVKNLVFVKVLKYEKNCIKSVQIQNIIKLSEMPRMQDFAPFISYPPKKNFASLRSAQ